ncbi:MAG: flagellar hook-length control protein FliK [Candidatus Sericytochromatia bacterium]|nr:flagellar hook-length control protein FliK [Candidatus Sericytochromatia bacterium]
MTPVDTQFPLAARLAPAGREAARPAQTSAVLAFAGVLKETVNRKEPMRQRSTEQPSRMLAKPESQPGRTSQARPGHTSTRHPAPRARQEAHGAVGPAASTHVGTTNKPHQPTSGSPTTKGESLRPNVRKVLGQKGGTATEGSKPRSIAHATPAEAVTAEVLSREVLAPELLALLAATVDLLPTVEPQTTVEVSGTETHAAAEGLIPAKASQSAPTTEPGSLDGLSPPSATLPVTTSSAQAGLVQQTAAQAHADVPAVRAARQTSSVQDGAVGGVNPEIPRTTEHGVAVPAPWSAPDARDGDKGSSPRERATGAGAVTSLPSVGLGDLAVVPPDASDISSRSLGAAEASLSSEILPVNETSVPNAVSTEEGSVTSENPAPAALGPVTGSAGSLSGTRRPQEPVAKMMATEIQEAVRTGPRSIRLTLRPEALGEVQLRVALVGGGVRATLHVDKAEAREVLGKQMEQVRQALADQGIRVDRLEVVWRGDEAAEQQPGRQDARDGQDPGQQGREGQARQQGGRRKSAAWQEALNEAAGPADMSLES